MHTRYLRLKDTTDTYPPGAVLTKYSTKLLEDAITQYNATQHHVQFSTAIEATVTTHGGNQYSINLETR